MLFFLYQRESESWIVFELGTRHKIKTRIFKMIMIFAYELQTGVHWVLFVLF